MRLGGVGCTGAAWGSVCTRPPPDTRPPTRHHHYHHPHPHRQRLGKARTGGRSPRCPTPNDAVTPPSPLPFTHPQILNATQPNSLPPVPPPNTHIHNLECSIPSPPHTRTLPPTHPEVWVLKVAPHGGGAQLVPRPRHRLRPPLRLVRHGPHLRHCPVCRGRAIRVGRQGQQRGRCVFECVRGGGAGGTAATAPTHPTYPGPATCHLCRRHIHTNTGGHTQLEARQARLHQSLWGARPSSTRPPPRDVPHHRPTMSLGMRLALTMRSTLG